MTLTEFLQARITEKAKAAGINENIGHISGSDYTRALAECAAVERIVKEWEIGANRLDGKGRPAHLFDPFASALLKSHAGWLRILASVYADHPDYQPEWRP